MATQSIKNLTSANVKKVKDLLEVVNKNEPNSTAWNDAEGKLNDLLWSFWEDHVSMKSTRMKYYSSEIFQLVIAIIKAEVGKHTRGTLDNAWSLVECGMVCGSMNDQDNVETVAKGVDLGFIELAVRELHFRPSRFGGQLIRRAFGVLPNCAAYSNFTNRVMSSGAPLACLELIREGGNIENETTRKNLIDAITTLNSIASFNVEPIKVLPGVVDAVKPYLPFLAQEGNDDMIVLGFSAARLIIRLYGKDDSSRVIVENPAILDFYPKFMRKVMDVGAIKSYYLYKSYWVLAGVALDLSLIAMSDTNKQLLVPIVPLMLEMMALHHNGDHDLIRYGVVFLSQVSFDESCLAQLQKDKPRVKVIQGIILSDKEHDKETLSLLGVVMNTVFPSPLATTAATTTATTITTTTRRRSSAFKKAASLVFGSTTTTPQIQVMISYHQKSTGQHAQALVQLFKKHKYNVWVDYENMKGDIQEAMAEAVQSSDIIVVLVSIGYKESANCRMECQYAMKQNKPLLFLVCEESYKSPTGWLGLIMGQRMWVGVFTPTMVENKAEEVIRRLDETLKGENENEVATAVAADSNVGSAITTTTSIHHGPTISELVTTLMKKVTSLEEKTEDLKSKNIVLEAKVTEIDILKSKNIALEVKTTTLETKMTELEAEITNIKGNKSS
jgi:hypothetical protein